jgi:hypothetical protein
MLPQNIQLPIPEISFINENNINNNTIKYLDDYFNEDFINMYFKE